MNNQNNQQIELLEPVTDEKPIINKTKLLMNNLRDPKKNKKTIVMILGVLVVIVAIVLVVSMQKKFNLGGPPLNEDGTIAVETGTKWGNVYASFIQKEMEGYTTYDVALIDLDFNNTPEMLVKYKDSNNKDTLKIFYIVEDEVFSTKYFHLYSLHMLYSVESKEAGWYIHISSEGEFGAYTSLAKMINGQAFDSDIKTNTEKLLEEFKKKYVDAKYKIVFYQINSNSFIDDIKTVISRNKAYEKDINAAFNKLKKDNADKVYTPVVEGNKYENLEYLIVRGRKLSFGTYQAIVPEGEKSPDDMFLVINRDGTITYNGNSLKYVVGTESIALSNYTEIFGVRNNVLKYDIYEYELYKDENGQEIKKS